MSHPVGIVPQGSPVTPAHCHLHLQMESSGGLRVAQVTSVSGRKRSVLPSGVDSITSQPCGSGIPTCGTCEMSVLPPKEEQATQVLSPEPAAQQALSESQL